MLRDILRDQLVLKTEKIRDKTSQAFTMSLIKRTECNLKNFIRPKRKILGASEICPTAHSSPGPPSPSGLPCLDQGSSELVIIDS